jgi:hypothetical protein
MCRRHQAVLRGSSIFHLFAGSIFVLLTYRCSPVNDVKSSITPTQVPTLVDYSSPISAQLAATKPKHIILARASWYGPDLEGRKTASGERFSSSKMTAAARGLPLGARVVVTNLRNGRRLGCASTIAVHSGTAEKSTYQNGQPIKSGLFTTAQRW